MIIGYILLGIIGLMASVLGMINPIDMGHLMINMFIMAGSLCLICKGLIINKVA
jgi:VIT1/CCC1 family predicted Fe2+/Mn2+ transporter